MLGVSPVLCSALLALGALPVLSPEIGPAPAVGFPASDSQHYAMAASNGTGFIVVWQDFRGGSPSGTRLDAAGRVLDPIGLPIGTPTYGRNPTAGSDGQDYLVVWEDYRGGSRGYVYGQRVTASGLLLDPGGFQISTFSDQDQVPSVAYGAGTYLVAWADYSAGFLQIWGARITPTGAVLDPLGIPISAGPNEYGPSVAFDGQNFLVTWYVSNQVRAARVTPAGMVLDAPHINVTGGMGGQYPAAGFDGQSFLVLFNRGTDVYGARVATDGGVLDAVAFPVSAGTWSEYYPSVACGPSGCAGAWLDGRDAGPYGIYGARIDQAGTVLDDAGVWFMNADSYRPAVAFNGTNYLFATDQDEVTSQPNIFTTLASGAFAPITPGGTLTSTAPAAQSSVEVASDGTDFLMVWQDQRNEATTGLDIYAARVARDGGLIDPLGFPVCTAAGDQVVPTAAFVGNAYLVSWMDYRDGGSSAAIWAARVDSGGRVVDPGGFQVTPPGPLWGPRTAGLDGGALVVWQDDRNGPDSGTDLYFARVDRSGTVLDPGGSPLVVAPGRQLGPRVDCNEDVAAVVWTDYRGGPQADVYGATVDRSGTVDPPGGLAIASGPYDERAPAVAAGRSGALVVWEDTRDAGITGLDLYAARLNADGAVLDPGGFPVSAVPRTQSAPSVSFDGAEYLVVWEDTRNSTGWLGRTTDVWATRITSRGEVLDDGGFAISEDSYDEYSPSAASDLQGHVLVGYTRAPLDTVERALARMVTGLALEGDFCGAASRCASGFCVDGVCCDSACGGGAPGDCVACSVKAGALVDGVCATLGATSVCRPTGGLCDVEERCDGTSPVCPQDGFSQVREVCRPAAGDCDVPESCTGQGAACPADLVASAETTCRPTAGPCDVSESCNGQSAACPDDAFATQGTSCGVDGGVCSGAHPQCERTLQVGCGCASAPDGLALAVALVAIAAWRRRGRALSATSCG